ncbi:MAG: hypothetical protein HY263_05590 [Chloroflexi bacterium]|nr:hypothetical protein [Chloroflexota bacterium]
MTDPQAPPPDAPAPADRPAPGGNPDPADRPASTPSSVRDVEYKGAPLDAAKGPGLGCFWLQLAALALLVVVTPLSVGWGWPAIVSGALLIVTLILLLFAGQTVIFLLRLVAADRRAELRRAPLASRTPTVGQIEDEGPASERPGDGGSAVPE